MFIYSSSPSIGKVLYKTFNEHLYVSRSLKRTSAAPLCTPQPKLLEILQARRSDTMLVASPFYVGNSTLIEAHGRAHLFKIILNYLSVSRLGI